MIIILDTSAAIEIVLQRKMGAALAKHIADADLVMSPRLFIPEITNVFWKYHMFSDMPMDICEMCIEKAIAIPDEYVEEMELYKEAFALGCLSQKPVYDMFFLVLARRNSAHLLTLDKSLKQIAKKYAVSVI